ncbi:MAG: hypothetical protein ACFHX7_04915 [Pseudomonadota bacterium]
MVKIVIQETLYETWRPVVEREVNLALGAVRESGRQFRIRFYSDVEARTSDLVFCCDVLVSDGSNRTQRFEARHSDGQVAIRNALNRVRRDQVRRTSFSRSPMTSQGQY